MPSYHREHASIPQRAGIALIEVLIAVVVLALLAAAFYGTLVSSVRGISTDRLTEAKRFVTMDLLERFCHPYSDLSAVIPDGQSIRELTVDEALRWTGVPAASAAQVAAILREGGVTGFTLLWNRGIDQRTTHGPRTLRLHMLTCIPKLANDSPGPRVDSFRVWSQRGDR